VARGEGGGFDLTAEVKEGGDSRGLGLDSAAARAAAVDRRFSAIGFGGAGILNPLGFAAWEWTHKPALSSVTCTAEFVGGL
jgi:hypothetical protein